MGEGNASRGEGVNAPEVYGILWLVVFFRILDLTARGRDRVVRSGGECRVRRTTPQSVQVSIETRRGQFGSTSAAALDQWTGEGGWGPTGSTEITSEAAAGQVASRAAVCTVVEHLHYPSRFGDAGCTSEHQPVQRRAGGPVAGCPPEHELALRPGQRHVQQPQFFARFFGLRNSPFLALYPGPSCPPTSRMRPSLRVVQPAASASLKPPTLSQLNGT